MESAILKLIIVVTVIGLCNSCAPKYFEIVDDCTMFNTLLQSEDSGTPHKFNDYTKYKFKLVPYEYFKKNKHTTSLLSDSSTFLQKNLLFHLDGSKNQLEQPENYLNNSWFRMEAFFENIDTNFITGSEFILRTIAGRNKYAYLKNEQDTIVEGKLMYVYKGRVGPVVPLEGNLRAQTLLYIDQVWKISRDKVKKDGNDGDKLMAIVVEKKDNHIAINAVIDINYKRRSEKPIIYDLKAIFGEPIWINKTEMSCKQ